MPVLPMTRLGAHEVVATRTLEFSILLPGIDDTGYRVWVSVVHEKEALLSGTHPVVVALAHGLDPSYGDRWDGSVSLADSGGGPSWGEPGTYLYWYIVEQTASGRVADHVVDPFAREFGVGRLSAITVGFADYGDADGDWAAGEPQWKVPNVEDLIVYELMLSEFGGGIAGTIARLDYLRDLGVNCLELMPVTNVVATSDWGYMPIGFFGVDDRFGNRADLQLLVHQAHRRGMAVILDAVYAHTSNQFCYSQVYRELGIAENPFLGSFAAGAYGESVDYGKPLARDYFLTVNEQWLEKYHVDGFRYDYVPGYYDYERFPLGPGYPQLVYDTYQMVKQAPARFARFHVDGRINLIQAGEDLDRPMALLENTYSTGSWQNQTLKRAYDVAQGHTGAITALGECLAALGYPELKVNGPDVVQQRPFQYIGSHDESQFIAQFGIVPDPEPLFIRGDREQWYKAQPYLIAVLLSKGTPMLWQAQELCEDYTIPPDGSGRVYLERPMHWAYAYDQPGARTLELVRKLLRLRNAHALFRSGRMDFWNEAERYQNRGLLVYSRRDADGFALVAVNFTDRDVQDASLVFPKPGVYREALHGRDDVGTTQPDERVALAIPSHYGRVWMS